MNTPPYFCVEPPRFVQHDIYRNVPGDDYWTGIDDLGTDTLLENWPVLSIVCEDRKELPDYFSSGGKPVVTDRFKLLCEEFKVAAEYLPVKVARPMGLPPPFFRYWVLHPLERIDCIDIDASIFEMYGKPPNFTVKRYQQLKFIPEVVGDRALFRPQHDPAIYASTEFRKAAEERKLWVKFSPLPGN